MTDEAPTTVTVPGSVPGEMAEMEGIVFFTAAAREIAAAEGWDNVREARFTRRMLQSILEGSPPVRHPQTGAECIATENTVMHCVHRLDVADWLKGIDEGDRWRAVVKASNRGATTPDAYPQEAVQSSQDWKPRQRWRIRQAEREDDLRKALRDWLARCDTTQPAPDAKAFLRYLDEHYRIHGHYPTGILGVKNEEVTYQSDRADAFADLGRISKRIRRLIEPRPRP